MTLFFEIVIGVNQRSEGTVDFVVMIVSIFHHVNGLVERVKMGIESLNLTLALAM